MRKRRWRRKGPTTAFVEGGIKVKEHRDSGTAAALATAVGDRRANDDGWDDERWRKSIEMCCCCCATCLRCCYWLVGC